MHSPSPPPVGADRLAFRGLFRLLDAFWSNEHRLEVRFYYAPLEYSSFGFIKDDLKMSNDAFDISPRTSQGIILAMHKKVILSTHAINADLWYMSVSQHSRM